MKHFIGVEDYEISPRWKAPQKKRSSIALGLAALYVLRKYHSGKKKKGGGGSTGGRSGSSQGRDTRQRCTVKMHYSRNMAAHKEQINRYLVKEGKGKDGTIPQLYGTPEAEYRKAMTDKNFRIFLSPASNNIPLDTLTKAFVASLEKQTGYKLYWVASEHYDTAHHHVHVLINGTDAQNKDVFFPPDMVKTFMRENAMNICTSLVGSRTKEDMTREKEGSLTANRYTWLDEKIKEKMIHNTYRLKFGNKENESVLRRLDHLCSLGMCSFKDNEYIFSQSWEDILRTNGRYNTFLSARKALKYTNEQNLELYTGKQGSVSGVITKIYKTDEVSDNHALLLEGIDGKAYFIPLFHRPSERIGEGVRIVPEKNQRGRLTPKVVNKTERELFMESEEMSYKKGYASYLRNEINSIDDKDMLR